MKNENLENLLIDYIDGKLGADERSVVEEQIKTDASVRELYEQLKEVIRALRECAQLEPSHNLKKEFDTLLQAELNQGNKGETFAFYPVLYKVAATIAFIMIAGGVGFWIHQQQRQAAELEAMRKEVQATKQLMMAMLDNQQSASQRLMGANVAFNDIDKADNEIIDALIRAMNEDENTNVRIAALEALGKFHAQPHVKQALISALNSQQDPLVQIALIRLMVEMQEKGIKKELERISTDEEMLPAVKDEAHAGLLKLS